MTSVQAAREAGRVIVAGGINIDLVIKAAGRPRPGETVIGASMEFHPGGKGSNQAVAAARLGARAAFIGRLGDDAFASRLESFLDENGVGRAGLERIPGETTGAAMITIAESGENSIAFVPGANRKLRPADFGDLDLGPGDIAVTQLEITLETAEAFLERAKTLGAKTVLNCAPADPAARRILSLADIIVVNETELAALSGRPAADLADEHAVISAAQSLLGRPSQTVIATLGPRGAIAVAPNAIAKTPGRKVRVVDTTGAGDCFIGALAARLAAGSGMKEALDFANAAASVCVQRMGAGTSLPRLEEVAEALP